MKFYC